MDEARVGDAPWPPALQRLPDFQQSRAPGESPRRAFTIVLLAGRAPRPRPRHDQRRTTMNDTTPTADARTLANRKNALKSTGPRTPEGKKRSSMNALKHGLTATTVLLPGEDAGAYEDRLDAWTDDLRPVG